MAVIFADSFYFIALLNEGDELHNAVRERGAALFATLLTTEYVLLEVADALAATPFRDRIRAFFDLVRDSPQIHYVGASERLFTRGLSLYAARSDKRWSLTDCISFVVMHERNVIDVLTHDHHFKQAGFRLLL